MSQSVLLTTACIIPLTSLMCVSGTACSYGKFVFMQYPVFANVLAPFEPLIRLYFSVPFAGLVAFFAVYLGIINNPSLSRFVRFNAMQAVLLDVILM